MPQIRKFPIDLCRHQVVEMPQGAEILYVGFDPLGQLCLWAKCQVEIDSSRTILMYGEEDMPNYDDIRHLGSVMVGNYVWHIFDPNICSVDSKLRDLSREIDNLDDRICQIRDPDRDY